MHRHTTGLLIAGLLLGMLVLAPTATPFRVESATSDTMAPTIESGDAYVTVPADSVSRGDVVVFWAPEEGRFLTRAVLGVEEGGYRLGTADSDTDPPENDGGGANASAEQSRVVPRSAVVATVLTVGGAPVVLPGMGGVFSALAAYRIVGLFLALLVVAGWVARRRLAARASGRTVTIRVGTVAAPLLAVLFVTCVAITPLSATSYRLTYAETGGADAAGGESLTREVSLPVATPPLTRWIVRGETATVANWTPKAGSINATLSVPPPGEAGRTIVAVHLFPYPAWLSGGVLGAAHDVHPVVASLLGAVTLVGPLAIPYRLFVDGRRPIARVRRRRLFPVRRE